MMAARVRLQMFYDMNETYLVHFLRRPLGMLVEDRGGLCTVVELQNEEDGRIGQAAVHGVLVDDVIISLGGMDTRHLNFNQLTERIRSSQVPFTIGFARNINNIRSATPPPSLLSMPGRYPAHATMGTMLGAHPHHHPQHPHPMTLVSLGHPSSSSRDWSGKPPQATIIRPRAVAPMQPPGGMQQGGAGPSSMVHLFEESGGGQHQQQAVKRGIKRPPHDNNDSNDGAGPILPMRQVRQKAAPLPEHLSSFHLEAMMEEYGREAIKSLLEQPHPQEEEGKDDDNEEGEGEAGGGESDKKQANKARGGHEEGGAEGKAKEAVQTQPGQDEVKTTATERTIIKAKKRYIRVREELLKSRQASDQLYEYSRALLERGEVMDHIECRVLELLQHRAIDVRDKVQELRGFDPTHGNQELRLKWNQVNEQRRQQLSFKRQVMDRSKAELDSMVTETIPQACRKVEAELSTRMADLEKLLGTFRELRTLEQEGKRKGSKQGINGWGGGGDAGLVVKSEAPIPPPPASSASNGDSAATRPHLLESLGTGGGSGHHHHHHHHDHPRSEGGPTFNSIEYKPPKIGSEYQIPDSGLPSLWAADVSLTSSSLVAPRLAAAFQKEGHEQCRWKPPPSDAPGMPTEADVDELISNFRPELEEVVLWELYKRGWDVKATLHAVKQQLMQGGLKKEGVVEPLSRAEAAIFEKAMTENYKDFLSASRMIGNKSVKSCIAYHYNTFKRTEAYKRLKAAILRPIEEEVLAATAATTTTAPTVQATIR